MKHNHPGSLSNNSALAHEPVDTSVWDTARARAWHRFMSPERPSRDELAHYQRRMHAEQDKGHKRALLLGSTPELRNLAHLQGWALTAIDNNADVYEELAMLVNLPGDDEFICGDWTRLPADASHDLLLSDGAMNLLPVAKHADFIAGVAGALRPGGLALMRTHLYATPEFKSPAEVFSWFIRYGSGESVFSATRTHLDMLWMDPETQGVNFSDAQQRLRALFLGGEMLEGHFQAYESLLTYYRMTLYYAMRGTFEKACTEHFDIEQILHGRDYSTSEQHPIYALRKR